MHPIVLNGIKEEELPVVTSPGASSVSSSVSSSNSSSNKLNKSGTNINSTNSAKKKNGSSNGTSGRQQQQQLAYSEDLNNEQEHGSPAKQSNPMIDSALFKEYQKNKAQIIQQMEEQERRREEFVKQLKCKNTFFFTFLELNNLKYFFKVFTHFSKIFVFCQKKFTSNFFKN